MSCNGCQCGGDCSNALYDKLDGFIASQPKTRDSLIPVLHKAQSLFGFLPVELQQYVGKALDIPSSEIYGVVTFYSFFTMQPRGRHTINVCLGTACYVRGAKKVIEALTEQLGIGLGETTPDQRFSLTAQRCFGACGLAPAIMIDEDVHGRVTPKNLSKILAEYK